MSDKICVYFNNDYRAVFDRKDVLMLCAPEDVGSIDLTKMADMTVVNWNNVCFVNLYKGTDHEEADREV